MPEEQALYTYRGGQKVPLAKRPDQFVVRAQPEELEEMGITDAERVSSSSSRVTVGGEDLEPAMSAARGMAPTHHAYEMAESGQEFLITDRVFVRFREGTAPEQMEDLAGRYGLVVLDRYSPRDLLFQLTQHTGMNPIKLVVKLTEEEPLVEGAEHDLNVRASTYLDLPTDPSYLDQWHLHTRSSDPAFDARASARCEEAWQLLDGFGSAEVVVGVTDDGCRLDHSDFDAPGKFAGWGYFEATRLVTAADFDADPARMYQTGANHGTSCAGVIAGEVDALRTVGAAPGCRLLPIKWESTGASLFISDSKLLTALNHLASRVDVMSNSWGSTPTTLWATPVVDRIRELAQTGGRRGRGIVFLWAAGNENSPVHHQATVDVPFTSGWSNTNPPFWEGVRTSRSFRNNLVGIDGVMHVAALASGGRRSHYSNYGTGIGLCAPSSNVHKYRRLQVPGLGVTTTTGAGGGITGTFGGTSSATPLVAGIAALVLSAAPQLSAVETIALLKRTCAKDLDTTPYVRTPSAAFDPNPTWDISPIAPFDQAGFSDQGLPEGTWSPWFGHGRVDALAAVTAARNGAGPGDGLFVAEDVAGIAIPDRDPAGIERELQLPAGRTIREIAVSVDITHPWISDLRVELVPPAGAAAVPLHNRTGGAADDVRRTWSSRDHLGLRALRGQGTGGSWRLKVADLASRDEGKLNTWKIQVET
ncbi:MAG TPA: S8 family serine peptidase [Thermoanaerobaculia bacterium]